MSWATVRAGGRRGCVVPPVVLPSALSAPLRVASRLPLSLLLAGVGLVWFAVAWLSPAHAQPESVSGPVVDTVALAAPLRSAEPAGNGGGGDGGGGGGDAGSHDGSGNAKSKESSGGDSGGKSGGSKSGKGPSEDQTDNASGASKDKGNGGQSGGARRDRGPDEQQANNASGNKDRNPGNGQTAQPASQRTGQQPDQEQTDAASRTRQSQPGTPGTGEQPQPDRQPVNAATGQPGHPTATQTGAQTEDPQTFAARPRPTDNAATTTTGDCGRSGTCTAQTANLTRPQDGEHQATGEQTCQAAGGTGCGSPGQATQQAGTGPTQTARTTETATQPQPDQQLPGQPNPGSPATVSNGGQTGNAGAPTAATGQQANAGQADTRNASAEPDSAQRTDNRPQDTLAGADPPTPGTNATNANLTHSPGATTTRAVTAGTQPNTTTNRGSNTTAPAARNASLPVPQRRPNAQVISDSPSVNNPQAPVPCGAGTCPGTPPGQQPGAAPGATPGHSPEITEAEDSNPHRLSRLGNLLTRPDLRGAGQPNRNGAPKPDDDRAPLPAPSLPAPNPNTPTNLGAGQSGAGQAGGHRGDVDPGLRNLFDPTGALGRTDNNAGRQGATDPQALPVQGRAPPRTEQLVPNGDGSPRREYSDLELRQRAEQGRIAPKKEVLDDLSARQRALDEEIGRYNGQREHPQEQYNALKAKQDQLTADRREALRAAAQEFDDARAPYNQARGKGGLVDRSLEGLSPEDSEKVLDHMATRGVPRTTEDLLSGLSHRDPAAPGTADAAKREKALKELFVDFDTSSPDKQLLSRNLTDPERLDQAFRDNADFWGRNARKFDRSVRGLDRELTKRDLPQLYELTKNAARALIPGGTLLGAASDTLTDPSNPITRSLTGPAGPLASAVDNNARGDFNDIVGHLAENGVRSLRDIGTELSNLGKTPQATNPNASQWDQYTGAAGDLSNHALIGETPQETYERLVPFSAGIHQLGGNIANRYAPLARGDTSKLGTDYYNHPLKTLLEDSTPLLLVTPGAGLLRAGAGKILSGTTRAARALRAGMKSETEGALPQGGHGTGMRLIRPGRNADQVRVPAPSGALPRATPLTAGKAPAGKPGNRPVGRAGSSPHGDAGHGPRLQRNKRHPDPGNNTPPLTGARSGDTKNPLVASANSSPRKPHRWQPPTGAGGGHRAAPGDTGPPSTGSPSHRSNREQRAPATGRKLHSGYFTHDPRPEDLSPTGFLNSRQIRFSQDTAGRRFKDGRTVDSMARGLGDGTLAPTEIPAIRLYWRNNQLYTLDNRRLAAFQQAGKDIPYRMASRRDIRRYVKDHHTTRTHGTSIVIR